MSRVKDLLAGTGYWLGWKALCHLPESWVRWAFTTVTEIAWRRQGHGVQVLEGNLLRVLGPGVSGKELRAVSRAGMRSYGRYWMEVFRLPAVGTERILRDMQINADADRALHDVANGKGGSSSRCRTWATGRWPAPTSSARGIKFATVAERIKPESVFDMFLAFRESLGMEVLPLTGGANVFGVLAQRLRAGHLVCLLCDRDLTESGVEVDFFGEKARMAAGPAALAVQTGAAAARGDAVVYRGRLGRARQPGHPGPGRGRPQGKGGGHDPAARLGLREGHRRAPRRLAHAAAGVHQRPRSRPLPGPGAEPLPGPGAKPLPGSGAEPPPEAR